MPAPSKFIKVKTIDTRSMSTAEWDMVDAQIRERAFFMAGVADAKILNAFQDAARGIASGKYSDTEARRILRQQLREFGYQPSEDERGGIHDLSSVRRMEVTLETNVRMAQGWAERQAMLGDAANPGLEFYRMEEANAPRNWKARWQEAADSVGWEGVAQGTPKMIALTESPIWCALSRFNQPYPPFDFNSHMGVKPVPVALCRELGLVPPLEDDAPAETEPAPPELPDGQPVKAPEGSEGDWTTPSGLPRRGEQPEGRLRVNVPVSYDKDTDTFSTPLSEYNIVRKREDLNANVELDISDLKPKMRELLEERLCGLGKVVQKEDGKWTIQMTNLNGTSEIDSETLAKAWKTAQTLGIPLPQMEAYKHWVNNSSFYDELRDPKNQTQKNLKASKEERTVLEEFLHRLTKIQSNEIFYRSLAFASEKAFRRFLRAVKENMEYSPLASKPADCFSSSLENAEYYAEKRKYQVIMRVNSHKSARDIRPFYRTVPAPKQTEGRPLIVESEVVFLNGTRFQISNMEETRPGNGVILVTCDLDEI